MNKATQMPVVRRPAVVRGGRGVKRARTSLKLIWVWFNRVLLGMGHTHFLEVTSVWKRSSTHLMILGSIRSTLIYL